jgi:hypothetical protein
MSHPDLVMAARVLGRTDALSTTPASRPAPEHYTVIPSVRSPRLLVPRRDRRVAAVAVRHAIVAASRRARLRQAVLAGLFSLGVGRRSVGDLIFRDKVTVDGPVRLSSHLAAVLHTDVRLSMRFGPDRANRKPVLQVLDASGTCIAFVKVGVNALTRELVRREVAVLTRLEDQDLGPVRAPRVRYAGQWHADMELMVVDALPVWLPEPVAGAVETARIAAMRAVAGLGGVRSDAEALDGYLSDLAGRVRALDPSPSVGPLLAALDRVRHSGLTIPIGAWHGDWTDGNMAVRGDDVLLWDWERFAGGVPVGFDALHFEFNRAVGRLNMSPAAAATSARERAGALLGPLDVPPRSAGAVWTLYAVEVATRFLTDRLDRTTSKLGRVSEWLEPALAAGVAMGSAAGTMRSPAGIASGSDATTVAGEPTPRERQQ